jgi:hypothetical protein
MKPNKTPSAPPPPAPTAPLWRPTWKWHLKVLTAIYIGLTAAYFAIDHFLARLPEPYRLRDVPPEMTPWLKNK